MKLISLFFLVQALFLSVAPAMALLPEADCCAAACAEEEGEAPAQEQHSDSEAEQCNPFSCAGCCLLVLPDYQQKPYLAPARLSSVQVWALIANPPLQPQWGIWHPPRLA